MSCLCRNVSFPSDIEDLLQKEVAHQPDSPVGRLGLLAFQLCNLRSFRAKTIDQNPSRMLDTILAMDGKLAAWPENLSKEWKYHSSDEVTQALEGSFEPQNHVYTDYWHALVWNTYRAVFIICNETLLEGLDCLEKLPPFTACHPTEIQWYRQRALGSINRLANDICASVPMHLTRSYSSPVPAAATSFVLWPLYIVGAIKNESAARQVWAIDRLEHIRDTVGLPLARSMAQLLKSKRTSQIDYTTLCKNLSEI